MKATEFDQKFYDGEDIAADVDRTKARRPNMESRRIYVDFPSWMVDGLDEQAERLGISRQALIKMWIADRLK
jgi:hypothetical protein